MASPEVQEGLLNRVVGIPVVQSAYGKVADAYVAGKGYSRLMKFACDTVESSVQLVAATAQPLAQPLVGKFEGPLQAADAFACRQLDRLEEAVPIITATPEEMVTETKRFVQEKLVPGAAEKLSNNAVCNVLAGRVDHVISFTDRTVDVLLPETDITVKKVADEPTEPVTEDPTRWERCGAISFKVAGRLRFRAVNHLASAQKSAQQALDKLKSTLEVMEQAQEQLKAQRARLTASVEEQAEWLRSSVAAQGQRVVSAVEGGAVALQTSAQNALPKTIQLPGGKTVELQTLLDHSRRLTNTARTAFVTAAAVAEHLPEKVQNRAQEALKLAKELTQLVHNVALGHEVSRAVLERATLIISQLNSSTSFFSDYIRSFFQPSKQQEVQMDEEESPLADQSPAKSVPATFGNPVHTSSPVKEAPVKEKDPSDDEEEEEEVEDDSVVDQSVLDTDV